jgi:hypothetical protein
MNEKDLRDCFAMFKAVTGASAEDCYRFADAMLEVRNKDNDEEELGIAAVKPKRKYLRGGSR